MTIDNAEDAFDRLAPVLFETAQRAGQVIRDIYAGGLEVRRKEDASPVTDADEAAEEIILADLARHAPGIPVIAEEAVTAGRIPETGDVFFLVDPLDGTREFVRGTGEFTVNIALVRDGAPCFGIIHTPAVGGMFITLGESHAVRADVGTGKTLALADAALTKLRTRAPIPGRLTAVASRSSMNDETQAFLDRHGVSETRSAGSSLKFCVIAAGEADVYPRLAPTSEWDTAAGDAILRAAGGVVLREDGTPLNYGKRQEGYLNPGFIAWGRAPAA